MANNLPQSRDTPSFIANGRARYGSQYDYSRVAYVNAKSEVSIGCSFHPRKEWFGIKPTNHLTPGKSGGCKKCKSEKARKRHAHSIDDVKAAVDQNYKDRFDLTNCIYSGRAKDTIDNILCKLHNKRFSSTYDLIKQKRCAGCEDCKYKSRSVRSIKINLSRKKDWPQYHEKLCRKFNDCFDFKLVEPFQGLKTKIKKTCKKCGTSKQLMLKRMDGQQSTACITCVRSQKKLQIPPRLEVDDPAVQSLLSDIRKSSGKRFAIEISGLGAKISQTSLKATCKKCGHLYENLRPGNALNPEWLCKHCPDVKLKAKIRSDLKRLRAKHENLVFSEKDFNQQGQLEQFTCPVHFHQELKPGERMNGCTECKDSSVFRKVTDAITNHYAGRYEFGEIIIQRDEKDNYLKLNKIQCLEHNPNRSKKELFSTSVESILQQRFSCRACRSSRQGEGILAAASKRHIDTKEKAIQAFLEKVSTIEKHKNLTFPFIQEEWKGLTGLLTVRVGEDHATDELQMPSRIVGSRKVGTQASKAIQLRKVFAADFENDVVPAFLKVGLFLDSNAQSLYKNGRSKLPCTCAEGHQIARSYMEAGSKRRGCPICSDKIGEKITRAVFEHYFGFDFPKDRVRTKMDKTRELDGHAKKQKIAFEYQGAPHVFKDFHRNSKDWYDQQSRDKETRQYCKQSGIKLFEVILYSYDPDTNSRHELFKPEIIRKKVQEAFKAAEVKFEIERLPDQILEPIIFKAIRSSPNAEANLRLLGWENGLPPAPS